MTVDMESLGYFVASRVVYTGSGLYSFVFENRLIKGAIHCSPFPVHLPGLIEPFGASMLS